MSETKGSEVLSSVIPYKNVPALVGYYLAVFSILGFFPLLGIIGTLMGIAGFVLGIMGLKYAAANPEAKGKVHAWIGILVGGFFAVTTGIFQGFIILAMVARH